MGAALALSITLVVVVTVLSLAVNAQGPFQGSGIGQARPARAEHPGAAPPPAAGRPPRRPVRERTERTRERSVNVPPPAPRPVPDPPDADITAGDVKPLNSRASALVMSVVDERTLGPVTRSRLTLRVEPQNGVAFEVTTRVAFPTLEDRAKVKVGETIPVRYDSEDHRRVVVDTDKAPGD